MAEEFDFGSRPQGCPLSRPSSRQQTRWRTGQRLLSLSLCGVRSPVGRQLTSTPDLARRRWAELVGPDVEMAYVLLAQRSKAAWVGTGPLLWTTPLSFGCSLETAQLWRATFVELEILGAPRCSTHGASQTAQVPRDCFDIALPTPPSTSPHRILQRR
jgi:hypothetical protein